MPYITMIWIVWAVLGVVLLSLILYRVSITQNEEDRLFLDGADEVQHHEQDVMFAKLKSIEPAIQILGGLVGVATLAIAAFYVTDALRQF
ncbi:MAG TPA: hypothetical protein VN670_05160 [Acidobacteriaceae bacterium]|nr:hypothetical protein [Acidobacteriaceae bacterium]